MVARRATKTVRLDGVEEAAAVVAALRSVDKDIKKAVNAQVRSVVTPVWKDEVTDRIRRPMDQLVLGTGVRVSTVASGFVMHAANNRRVRSGGLVPVETWKAWEFGGLRGKTKTYPRRSPNGTKHSVTRHTKRQLPEFKPTGRVLFPATAEVLPRVASLWTQTALYHLYQAFKSL